MNRLQTLIRVALSAMFMLLAVVEVAGPQATSPAPTSPMPKPKWDPKPEI